MRYTQQNPRWPPGKWKIPYMWLQKCYWYEFGVKIGVVRVQEFDFVHFKQKNIGFKIFLWNFLSKRLIILMHIVRNNDDKLSKCIPLTLVWNINTNEQIYNWCTLETNMSNAIQHTASMPGVSLKPFCFCDNISWHPMWPTSLPHSRWSYSWHMQGLVDQH